MTKQITVNGHTYSDDGSVGLGMDEGGFRDNLLPMLGDTIIDAAGKVAAATGQAEIAKAQADIAIGAATSTVTGPGSTGTSTTSLVVGLGTKNFTMQTGKTLYPGMPMTIAASVSPVDAMYGPLVSYNSATGATEVKVTNISTSVAGTYLTAASWTISLSGPAGVTGVLNEFEGAPIASAPTINLDAATGNYLHLTGSAGPVTSVTLAQGAERHVTLDGTPTFVYSAGLDLPTGANVVGEVGDVVTFRGEGAGATKVTNWVRASGRALAVVPVIKPGLVLLAQFTPPAAAVIDIPSFVTADYDSYLIEFDGINHSGAGQDSLRVRCFSGGVVDSASHYHLLTPNSTSGSANESGLLTSNIYGPAGKGVNAEIVLRGAKDPTKLKSLWATSVSVGGAGGSYTAAEYLTAYPHGAVEGLRFFWFAGMSFAPGGEIRIYGRQGAL